MGREEWGRKGWEEEGGGRGWDGEGVGRKVGEERDVEVGGGE